MITTAELDRLLAAMQAAGLSRLEAAEGAERIVLELGAVQAPASAPAAPPPVPLRTRAMGRFRATHPVAGGAAVAPGDLVQAGQIIGFAQLDHVLTAITAPVAGVVAQVLATEGSLLGFGDTVMTLEGTP